uniref:Uncharacterized protein n=1 Tax=Spongospora subterranea TaxID=70186 RepID=A0A0H5QUR1_9EUKA|eukprot:CRZ05650.1 hypothetical protein [Spongospora subterranea]
MSTNVVPALAVKLQGPPKKKMKGEASIASRAQWTNSIVQNLLSLRYSDVVKARFHATKTNKQKSAFWLWFTARFNAKLEGGKFDADQVKRRLAALVAEWRSLQKAELETGNPDGFIAYPDYYDCMVACMQVILVILHLCNDQFSRLEHSRIIRGPNRRIIGVDANFTG